MLKWSLTIIVALIVSFIATHTNSADLTVKVERVRNSNGEIRLAIFNLPDQFPEGNEMDSKDVEARLGTVTIILRGLNPGVYAVAVHHDENSDKMMNKNVVGWPQEGYGFSNDARVIFSVPVFEAAAFNLNSAGQTIHLQVVY